MNDGSITLYHGSIYSFDAIDLSRGKPFKDFGRGFYTTRSREHAVSIAHRNRTITRERLTAKGIKPDLKIWLYTYEFPMAALERLSVKEFSKPTREWMRFVGANRANEKPQHNYDIVMGPTANDRTNLSIKTYFFGGYGEVGSERAIDILLEIIEPYELPPQIFFGTAKAAEYLILKSKEMI